MEIATLDNYYAIRFPFRPRILEAVKNLDGRRWNPVRKAWMVPVKEKEAVEEFARKYGFHFIEIVEQAAPVVTPIPALPAGNIDVSFLKVSPYPFQMQGIEYAANKKRLIIGDQPGLGKTLQSMAAVIRAGMFPCLIICPASLRENWRREWIKFTSKKVMILGDSTRNNYDLYHSTGMVDVFITNYESLKKYFVVDIKKPKYGKFTLSDVSFRTQIEIFRSVIVDELHRCKSSATQQSKLVKGITSGKEMVIGLTGTPVVNKPKDLIAQLSIIGRLVDFGGYKQFVGRYCSGFNEASNLEELNILLRTLCFIRREKHEVLKDLPAKQRQNVICDITNRREYQVAENDLIKYLKEYKEATAQEVARALRGEIMVRIGILKNISARGKLNSVFDFVDDILDTGEKLVLFVHLHEVSDAVMKNYPGAVLVTGGQTQAERQSSIDRFQQDANVKLIVCSIKAAGVGITLTASSRVGFIEFPWTFADCEQCEDRTHRIGQTDSVTAYYFLGKDTIDEKIYKIIQTKKVIAQSVTGSTEEVPESFVDIIANLFNQKQENEHGTMDKS